MFRVCRPLSRTVHEEHREEEEEEIYDKTNDADDEGEWKSLTVWRKSLVLSCSGFTVINSKGNLVYRVDNYRGHPNEIILMDGSGKSLLTIYHRKVLLLNSITFLYYKILFEKSYFTLQEVLFAIYTYSASLPKRLNF